MRAAYHVLLAIIKTPQIKILIGPHATKHFGHISDWVKLTIFEGTKYLQLKVSKFWWNSASISLHSASIIIQNISIIYTVLHQFTQCYLVRLCNVQNFVCFSASFYCRQCSRVLTKTSDCSSINILYYIVGQESLMGNQDLIQAPVWCCPHN